MILILLILFIFIPVALEFRKLRRRINQLDDDIHALHKYCVKDGKDIKKLKELVFLKED